MTTMKLMSLFNRVMMKLGRIGDFNDNGVFSNDDSAEHDGAEHDGAEHDGDEHDGDGDGLR